jgi:4-hydroxy-tetrahydrodipicolinate reductase
MNRKMKVVQYGMGPIGIRTTRYLIERDFFEIVGAIDIDPQKVGVDIGLLADLPEPLGVTVHDNPDVVFSRYRPDVVVLTTTSGLEAAYPQIQEIISHGISVVSTCEELSYPWITQPQISRKIDEMAKENTVAVLGTGVNPGFLMDFLPMASTAVCRQVKRIRVERLQNARYRRLPFQQKIGAGLTAEEFREKVKAKTLRHVGLTESMHLIASRLGWQLTGTEDVVEPVIAEKRITTPDLIIEAGRALGVNQIGRAYINSEEVITLIFRAVIGQPDPRDTIFIDGDPPVEMTIRNGINGDVATCAITVNAIPVVLRAMPGLKTMADIEPLSFFC